MEQPAGDDPATSALATRRSTSMSYGCMAADRRFATSASALITVPALCFPVAGRRPLMKLLCTGEWSRWQDLNLRSLVPQTSAIPGFATPRKW